MSQKGFLVRYISLKNRSAYMYTVLRPDPAPQRSGNNIATKNLAILHRTRSHSKINMPQRIAYISKSPLNCQSINKLFHFMVLGM